MRTFACVLKSGGDFTPVHVKILRNMVERYMPTTEKFVCMTDMEFKLRGVVNIPLTLDMPGKYSMMEVFFLPGPIIVTGLDTIILKNVDHIWEKIEKSDGRDFWMINSFNPKRDYANGIMGWNGDWSPLLIKYPKENAFRFPLEQNYTIEKLHKEKANIRVFNEHLDILSYKKHARGKTKVTADVVLFHGTPRPHEVADKWAIEAYQ